MPFHDPGFLLIIGYCVFYFLLVYAGLKWARSRRKSRLPFREDTRLLRSAGETLRIKVSEFEEAFFGEVLGALAVPVIALAGVASLAAIHRFSAIVILGIFFSSLIIGAGFSMWRVVRLWRNRANYYLGYFGERYVAEYLDKLQPQGWRILHDVPVEAAKKKFNLDHVAIGPGGVFVVETKTRRKQSVRPGVPDHKVMFDGQALHWPWGKNDSYGLDQAEANARWLAEWIRRETDMHLPVTPVLALPDWWVDAPARPTVRPVRVVNPKQLSRLLNHELPSLDEDRVSLIAAKLEALCRNVEY